MIARSLPRRLLAALLAITLVSLPATTFAGPEEAKEYYEQAKNAYKEGNLEKAAELLERAYAEDPNLVYQYNRILALQGMGEYEEALRVLDIYQNPMLEDGRFDDINAIRKELEKHLAEKKASDGDTGEQPGTDKPMKDRDGTKTSEKDETKATPPPDEDRDKSKDKDKDTDESSGNVLAWSLIGGGGASLLAGGLISTGIFISEDDRDAAACDEFSECPSTSDLSTQEAQDKQDAAKRKIRTQMTVSIVLLGVGLAAAGTGTYLLLSNRSSESESSASRGVRLRVTPYASADGGGGMLRIEF